MARCIVCGEKIKREYKKVCPDCGKLILKRNGAGMKFDGVKRAFSARLFFMENCFKYVVIDNNAAFGGMQGGVIGAAIGAAISEARNKDINTVRTFTKDQIAAIEYPTVEKGFGKERSFRIRLVDGESLVFGWGGKKKMAAVSEMLKAAYTDASLNGEAPIE